jgi:16S rRNA (adenine1518-N6/adenine1519-N6)-dimethyltransferase
MTVAQLSHLLPFLESIGVRPKKSLSQNFLIDPNIVRKTVLLADIQPGDQVLEIGPGPGALTAELLERGAFVTAIEKDSVFARELERFQNGKLTVIEADILTLNWALLGRGPWKVIGNLPYSITTPILERICEGSFISFTFMVQKELAERLIAKPGCKQCGSISVFVQSHGEIKGSFPVSRTCFYPSPTVDSTVLSLTFYQEKDPKEFFTFVRTAFQQRRKMITSSLKKLFPQDKIRSALELAKASITARPETLSLEQWRALFKEMQKAEKTALHSS